jgi:hypothetical protein
MFPILHPRLEVAGWSFAGFVVINGTSGVFTLVRMRT